eukprot:scaffold2630_cov195-Chaetoceros_neogracile.AAC.10
MFRITQRLTYLSRGSCKLSINHTIRNASVLSGMQKEVLSLYRKLLRAARLKDPESMIASLSNPDSTTFSIKTMFREKAMKLTRRDVNKIEYNIRQGEKYIKTLEMDGVKAMKSI